jgi:hypothetical protein
MELWSQIIIEDPEYLSGSSLRDLTEVATKAAPINYVLAMGVVGTDVFAPTRENTTVMTVEEFTSKLSTVTQIDWGSFLFFRDRSFADWITASTPLRDAIRLSIFSIRAVDDGYYYIYSKNDVVARSIRVTYQNAECRQGDIHSLDFPY